MKYSVFLLVAQLYWILDLNPDHRPPTLYKNVIITIHQENNHKKNLCGIKNVKDALREVSFVAHLLDNQLDLIGWLLMLSARKCSHKKKY